MSKRLGRLQRRGHTGWEMGCSRDPGPPGQAVCVPSAGGGANLASREGGLGRQVRAGPEWGARREKPTVGKVGARRDLLPLGKAAWVLNGDCELGAPAVPPRMGDPNESAPRFPCSWRGHFAPYNGVVPAETPAPGGASWWAEGQGGSRRLRRLAPGPHLRGQRLRLREVGSCPRLGHRPWGLQGQRTRSWAAGQSKH